MHGAIRLEAGAIIIRGPVIYLRADRANLGADEQGRGETGK